MPTRRWFAGLAAALSLAACSTGLPRVGDEPWDVYDVGVIDRQLRFELPPNAALYGPPEPSNPVVNDEGFVLVVFAGYGYDRRSGYGSRVHFTMHVKRYMNGSQGEPTPERLKRAVLTRSDYLERRAGREPDGRPVPFETLEIGGRPWLMIEHEPGFSLITFFDEQHYLTMVISTHPKFDPSPDQRAQLRAVMLEMAARMDIDPAR